MGFRTPLALRGAAAACLMAATTPAAAAVVVLDFEGLPYNQNANVGLFTSYGGLEWSNGGALAGPGWINVKAAGECFYPCGFVVGNTSGEQIATQLHGVTSVIGRTDPFQALSVQLASAWRNGENVTFVGLLNGVEQWTQSYTLNLTSGPGAGAPTFVTFNSGLINELRVTSSGGNLANLGGSSVGAVLDDFTYENAPRLIAIVPEPATWGMLILGFAAIGGAMRSRARRDSLAFGF